MGPVCLTRALNIHIRIRQSTHSNRTISKIIRSVKESSLAIRTSKKNPSLTFAIFAIFGDISGPFLASFLSKSRILLHLLFLRYLRYLSWVFSASRKNPCYFCDFCDIQADISGPFLVSFFFLSLDSCYFAIFCKWFSYIIFSQLFLLQQLRKQFASKFLLTRSILDISGDNLYEWWVPQSIGMTIFGQLPAVCH